MVSAWIMQILFVKTSLKVPCPLPNHRSHLQTFIRISGHTMTVLCLPQWTVLTQEIWWSCRRPRGDAPSSRISSPTRSTACMSGHWRWRALVTQSTWMRKQPRRTQVKCGVLSNVLSWHVQRSVTVLHAVFHPQFGLCVCPVIFNYFPSQFDLYLWYGGVHKTCTK